MVPIIAILGSKNFHSNFKKNVAPKKWRRGSGTQKFFVYGCLLMYDVIVMKKRRFWHPFLWANGIWVRERATPQYTYIVQTNIDLNIDSLSKRQKLLYSSTNVCFDIRNSHVALACKINTRFSFLILISFLPFFISTHITI